VRETVHKQLNPNRIPENTLIVYQQKSSTNRLLKRKKVRKGIGLGKVGRNLKAIFHTGHIYLPSGYIKNPSFSSFTLAITREKFVNRI